MWPTPIAVTERLPQHGENVFAFGALRSTNQKPQWHVAEYVLNLHGMLPIFRPLYDLKLRLLVSCWLPLPPSAAAEPGS